TKLTQYVREDAQLDDYFFALSDQKGVQSELAIPVQWGEGGEVIGIIDLTSKAKNAFDGELQRDLEARSRQIALPILLAQLKRRQELARGALDDLAKVGPLFTHSYPLRQTYGDIADTVLKLIPNASVCDVLRVETGERGAQKYLLMKETKSRLGPNPSRTGPEADEKRLETYGKFSVFQGLTGVVARTNKHKYFDTVQGIGTNPRNPRSQRNQRSQRDILRHTDYIPSREETNSEFAVPLALGDTVLGVLNVEADVPYAFSERDQGVIMLLAIAATVSIAHAEQYIRRIQQLESVVQRVKDVLRSGADMQELARVIRTSMGMLTQAEDSRCSLLVIADDDSTIIEEFSDQASTDEDSFLNHQSSITAPNGKALPKIVEQALREGRPITMSSGDPQVELDVGMVSRLVVPLVDKSHHRRYALDMQNPSLEAFRDDAVRYIEAFGAFALAALASRRSLEDWHFALDNVVRTVRMSYHDLRATLCMALGGDPSSIPPEKVIQKALNRL